MNYFWNRDLSLLHQLETLLASAHFYAVCRIKVALSLFLSTSSEIEVAASQHHRIIEKRELTLRAHTATITGPDKKWSEAFINGLSQRLNKYQ